MIRHFIAGILAAALMIVAKMALGHAALPHYPGFELSGKAGLMILGQDLGAGAVLGLLYGLFVRPVLPSSILFAALIFSVVPFVLFSMAWPMYEGRAVVKEPWTLLYWELDFFIYSFALALLGKPSGSKRDD
jgi:hypothetical protein